MTPTSQGALVAFRSVSSAGHPRRRARRTWPQRLLLSGGVLIVTACLLAAAGVWYAKHRLDNIETIALDNVLTDKGADAAGATSEFPTEVENYLIVGSDSRDGRHPRRSRLHGHRRHRGPRRAAVRHDHDHAVRPGHQQRRAPVAAARPLRRHPRQRRPQPHQRRLLQGPRRPHQDDHRVVRHSRSTTTSRSTSRASSASSTPSTVCPSGSTRPSRDANTGLPVNETGCVKLDGLQALQYARSRHLETKINGRWREDPTGDLGRISRQQDFIRRAMLKAVARGSSNPLVLNELIGAAADNLRIDDQLDLWAFANRLQTLQGTQIASYTVPGRRQVREGQRRAHHERGRRRAHPRLLPGRRLRDRRLAGHHAAAATAAPTTAAPPAAAAPPTTARPIGTVPGADKQCN